MLRESKQPLPRHAFVSLFDNATNACFEAAVSLESESVERWEHIPGVQPTITTDEQIECEKAVLESQEFRAALERHYGVSDTSLVMVDFWSAGNYGNAEEQQTRLARPLCFLRADPTDNGYARPIEGIRPVVDVNQMEVVRVEEYGHWPLPPQAGNYAASRQTSFRDDIKPLTISQPEGPGFTIEGRVVRWQNWKVVVGFTAREGLTLHDVSYRDQERERSILHRASLTEMVVPYGDPSPTQFRKNAFDVGEYGMGMCANSLVLGCDCLGEIRYMDAHFCNSRGEPLTIKNAVCLHEEDFGILWKHTDRRFADKPEVRRSRRLVISSVSTVENYEYGFFWYFYQDGNIQFEIKLTGILSLRTLQPGEQSPFGTMIAPQLFAPIHQHFFNMRLHFDVDGGPNSVYRVDVAAEEQNVDLVGGGIRLAHAVGADRQHPQYGGDEREHRQHQERQRRLAFADIADRHREDDKARPHQDRRLGIGHPRQGDVGRIGRHEEVVDLLGKFEIGIAGARRRQRGIARNRLLVVHSASPAPQPALDDGSAPSASPRKARA